MLKEFFGMAVNEELSDLTIKKCDVDKFKPVCNFLRRKNNTREKNIELLAWLIDFKPRPFSNYWRSENKRDFDRLSEITINEAGVIENNYNTVDSGICNNISSEVVAFEQKVNGKMNIFQTTDAKSKAVDLLDINEECSSSYPIKIDYPSGVSVSINSSDLNFIAKLIKI